MNRAILEACIPCLIALAVACGMLVFVVRFSGARWTPRRLLELHRSQVGSVPSLAFVLTLPVLVMLLLLIVQIAELMMGIMTVNYAAFASARAASVWAPAMIADTYVDLGEDVDGQNELPPGVSPGVPLSLDAQTAASYQSRKYQKIWLAAVLACATAAPSRSTADSAAGAASVARSISAMQQLYPSFDASGGSNPRIPQRISNKLGYGAENTSVTLQFEDRNSQPRSGTRTYNPIGHPTVTYYPSEVGWQDPISVTVYHDLALLPGAGRLLSKLLVRDDGKADLVAPRIKKTSGIYKTRLKASAVMTNEGIKSLRPYVHSINP